MNCMCGNGRDDLLGRFEERRRRRISTGTFATQRGCRRDDSGVSQSRSSSGGPGSRAPRLGGGQAGEATHMFFLPSRVWATGTYSYA